jgi:hypothetical protein
VNLARAITGRVTQLVRHATPQAFLAAAEPFLLADEVLHGLPLSVARSCRDEPDRYPGPNLLATIHDAGGAVSGVAVMTPPHRLQLYVRPDAVEPLVMGLAELPLSGVHGPVEVAAAFAARWAAARGVRAREDRGLRLFRLTRVIPPRPTPGVMRPAVAGDLPHVEAWYRAFFVETHHVVGALPPEEHARRAVAGGRVFLWVAPGKGGAWTPVAQAVAVALTPTMARIGAVYTPPEQRGRGGASAVVAGLSQQLLDEGRRPCLFTDLGNPTSNSIYKKIGYEAVADLVDFDLAP